MTHSYPVSRCWASGVSRRVSATSTKTLRRSWPRRYTPKCDSHSISLARFRSSRVSSSRSGSVNLSVERQRPMRTTSANRSSRTLARRSVSRRASASVWWGIPYNPYGLGPYLHAFALPFFDFEREVMLGAQFWDFVGGQGAYEELLLVYRRVGEGFAERLRELREQLIVQKPTGHPGQAGPLTFQGLLTERVGAGWSERERVGLS